MITDNTAMKKLLTTALLVSTALLSGCLVPEHFTARVDVSPDASYTFKYNGTAVYALAAAQLKQSGSLSAKDEAGLKAEADKIGRQPDVRRASYMGGGRYELDLENKQSAGKPLTMFDVFFVRTDKDGTMVISSVELKDKDKQELAKLDIKLDGTLEVSLPRNAEVISQNATSTPTLGFGTYSWKIGRLDQRPMLRVRLKS